MNPSEVGDVSETKVLSALVESGYTASIPFGDNARYDLVADIDNELVRVQVKTGRMNEGCITFQCRTKYRDNSGKYKSEFYTEEEIDAYAIYSPETDEIYWVWFNEAGNRGMRLRVDENVRETSQINWAEDYKLENALP